MSVQIVASPRFFRDMEKISEEVRKRLDKSLQQFIQNRYHPGLHFELVRGSQDLYSIRVGRNHRIILQEDGPDSYILLRIATHDIYQRL
ncbi:MAG: hypothetical protein HQL73_07830 [Magnetococcales bacterium]|nr:hypothetical protein [Magnetococcales bacterium]